MISAKAREVREEGLAVLLSRVSSIKHVGGGLSDLARALGGLRFRARTVRQVRAVTVLLERLCDSGAYHADHEVLAQTDPMLRGLDARCDGIRVLCRYIVQRVGEKRAGKWLVELASTVAWSFGFSAEVLSDPEYPDHGAFRRPRLSDLRRAAKRLREKNGDAN